jgi:hypothetical protein
MEVKEVSFWLITSDGSRLSPRQVKMWVSGIANELGLGLMWTGNKQETEKGWLLEEVVVWGEEEVIQRFFEELEEQ